MVSKKQHTPAMPARMARMLPEGEYNGRTYIPPDYSGLPYRPISQWTKSEIVKEARASGLPDDAVAAIRAIPESELKRRALVSVGWCRRGMHSPNIVRPIYRWTEFYRVDFGSLTGADDRDAPRGGSP